MRLKSAVLFLCVVFLSSPAFADLYEWTDSKGVIHITDDIKKVPPAYQKKVKVHETANGEAAAPEEAPKLQEEQKSELYGDYTLQWWLETFRKKREEAQRLESAIKVKRQYVDLFESGRRFGQTYGPAEVETYTKYKQELPNDERDFAEVQDEITELRRRATILGVPKEIREQ